MIRTIRMRVILMASVLSVGLLVVLGACGGGPGAAGGRTTIVASFYPLAFAAQEIGGPTVSVENLTPPGAEPHDLEVSPSAVADLRSAGLVLLLGRGFQPQLEDAAGAGSN